MSTVRINYSLQAKMYGIDRSALTQEELDYIEKLTREEHENHQAEPGNEVSSFVDTPDRLKRLIEALYEGHDNSQRISLSFWSDDPNKGEHGSDCLYIYNVKNGGSSNSSRLPELVAELWDVQIESTTSNWDGGEFSALLFKLEGFHPSLEDEIIQLLNERYSVISHRVLQSHDI